MNLSKLVFPGALLITQACAQTATESEGARSFIDWAAGRIVPIESLDSPPAESVRDWLGRSIGDARVVGLGESRHDTREQLLLKAWLVRFLVEERGFRGLVLEESYPHAEALDHYVTTGEGEPREILNGLAGWYLWDTEELLGVVEWLRDFNDDREPDDRVRLLGMDVTAPAPGVRRVLGALRRAYVETELDERSLGLELQAGDDWPTTWERYSSSTEERRLELGECYDELVELVHAAREPLVESSTDEEYEQVRRLAEIGRWGNSLFSAASREAGGEVRERGMAEVVRWLLAGEFAGERMILWAHDLHVARGPFRVPGFAEGVLVPMGMYLSEELGEEYLAIGGSFGSGEYGAEFPPGARRFEPLAEETMDGALAAIGEHRFLLDLRGGDTEGGATRWLKRERDWRMQEMTAILVPAVSFDLVYFVEEISRARPTPLALRRYSSLGDRR